MSGHARSGIPPMSDSAAAITRPTITSSHRRRLPEGKHKMSQLSEEQRLMRQSCRDFVDDVVIPFIRGDWQREWVMTPENRLPPGILVGADPIGIRTLRGPGGIW